MAENNAMNVRIVDGDDCCPQAMCVKVCNLVQEVRKTGASKKLIPSEKAVSDAFKGRQELLVAGAAEGILGPSAATGLAQVLTAPSSGVSIVDAIKGRTLKWNQLVHTTTLSGASYDAATGLWTINKTVAAGGIEFLTFATGLNIDGHKILLRFIPTTPGTDTTVKFYCGLSANGVYWNDVDTSIIFTSNAQVASIIMLLDNRQGADARVYNFTCYLQVLDLTAMFGSGYEPATVAEFTALFPNFPYAYNAGTLLPFKGTGVKVTGVNQWDEQWKLGQYAGAKGTWQNDTSRICSVNPIEVIPGETYYLNIGGKTNQFLVTFYRKDGTYVSNNYPYGAGTITIPTGVYKMHMSYPVAYGNTYNHDICINLSNAALNGTYKPYTETLVNIDAIGKTAKDADGNAIIPFPTGVNGDGTNNDEYGKDGGTIRWGVRAYEAGDESDATVITDGTNTVYPLDAEVPFTWDEPFTLAFTAEEGGTIWLQPEGVDEAGVPVSAPLNADIAYTVPAGQVINATTLDNLLDALKTAGVISAYTMTPDGNGNYTFTITA